MNRKSKHCLISKSNVIIHMIIVGQNIKNKFGEKFTNPNNPRFIYNESYADYVKENIWPAESGKLTDDRSKNILRKGIYAYHLERWFQYFDKSQFFIINYDTFYDEKFHTDIMIRIAQFLGISSEVWKSADEVYILYYCINWFFLYNYVYRVITRT